MVSFQGAVSIYRHRNAEGSAAGAGRIDGRIQSEFVFTCIRIVRSIHTCYRYITQMNAESLGQLQKNDSIIICIE